MFSLWLQDLFHVHLNIFNETTSRWMLKTNQSITLFFNSGIAIPAAEVIFGEGTGPIHYDELACSGLEQSINKCNHSNYNDCTHSEDAGVICDGSKIVDSDLFTMNKIISICTLELSPQSNKRQHLNYHTVKNSSKNPTVTSYKQKCKKDLPNTNT